MKTTTKLIIARVFLSFWALTTLIYINQVAILTQPQISPPGRLFILVLLWFTFVAIMNKYLIAKSTKNNKDNFTPNTPAI